MSYHTSVMYIICLSFSLYICVNKPVRPLMSRDRNPLLAISRTTGMFFALTRLNLKLRWLRLELIDFRPRGIGWSPLERRYRLKADHFLDSAVPSRICSHQVSWLDYSLKRLAYLRQLSFFSLRFEQRPEEAQRAKRCLLSLLFPSPSPSIYIATLYYQYTLFQTKQPENNVQHWISGFLRLIHVFAGLYHHLHPEKTGEKRFY